MRCCCGEIIDVAEEGGQYVGCGECACCMAGVEPTTGGCLTAAVEVEIERMIGGASC